MDIREFAERIVLNLPYDPNGQQIELIAALARFCSPLVPDGTVFLLNGYAGTGKTSVTGALVRALREVHIPVVLLAPTGRAAKVFSSFAGYPASTIHRRIYRSADGGLGYGFGEVAPNPSRNAVFIVDEASMIGEDNGEGGPSLLEDLIEYVYSADGCRMILLGDKAQLPPVGCAESPAMNPEKLRGLGLRVVRAVMTQVVRQGARSGILYNATWLRKALLSDPLPEPQLRLRGFSDVRVVEGGGLQDDIESAYASCGQPETIVITRSNRRATQFNLAIRTEILGRDEELTRGERLMVAKNNYLWGAKDKKVDFIANGDIAVVSDIHSTEMKYGLRFADVTLTLPDRDVDIECKILLDTLVSDTPAISAESAMRLYEGVMTDPDLFEPGLAESIRRKALRKNPYFNALQVKSAYAVTCHKSQGGQWREVFVDMGYIPPESRGKEFYRWLYTSVTRATECLHLINPDVKLIE